MLDGVVRWIWVRHWLGTLGCRTANLCVYGKTATVRWVMDGTAAASWFQLVVQERC